MKKLALFLFLSVLIIGCKEKSKKTTELIETEENVATENPNSELKIIPIEHATTVLEWGETTIYIRNFGFFRYFQC